MNDHLLTTIRNLVVTCRCRGKRLGVLGLLILASGLACDTVSAQWIEKEDLVSPLIDYEPFDLVELNDDCDNALMKIVPSAEAPDPLPDQGLFIFDYHDNSEDTLQVPYGSIASYKTFHQLLLKEAEDWLADGQYAEAFRNFLYVYDHGGKNDQKLVEALQKCLFLDAKDNFQAGRYELALSIFEDICRNDPDFDFPGIDRKLIDIIMLCYNGMIQRQFDAGNYISVRAKVINVEEKYPEGAKELSEKWRKIFVAKSQELVEEAKRLASAGEGRQAHLTVRGADQMSPGRPEVKQLQEQILLKFPLIIVGVSQDGSAAGIDRLANWGARRVGRLITRSIVELTGLADEGGKYVFSNGELYRSDEIGMKYTFELKPESRPFGTPPIAAFEVASLLLEKADRESGSFNQDWAKVFSKVSIENDRQVSFELRVPFVLPHALLKFGFYNPGSTEPLHNGLYVPTQKQDSVTTFEFNPNLDKNDGRQHPVIIEQAYRTTSDAVDDLLTGSIDVVDRIPVSDIARIKSKKGILVRSYTLPTVHFLVPKIRGDLENNLNFRSGLSYAINREMMVRDVICGGVEVDGCEVLSGPLPLGTEEHEQLGYGYDMTVRPPPFNPKLAAVRVEIGLTDKKRGRIPIPNLVIAHPKSSTAAESAAAIARAWSDIGVETSTRELPAGQSVPTDNQWDFLYMEAVVEEPLTDIASILGKQGFAKNVSAPVDQTLRSLSYVQSWRAACTALRRLHRQVSVDLSVIPLWQIKEHYAYRNTVKGVGRELIHLYQNVDRWQIDLYGSDEK